MMSTSIRGILKQACEDALANPDTEPAEIEVYQTILSSATTAREYVDLLLDFGWDEEWIIDLFLKADER